MKKIYSFCLLAFLLSLGNLYADPIVLFHETFGNNTGSARDWNESYSVKSGVLAVYSGISSYTISNAKQGKNTTGSTQSGLNQASQGTDAYVIIGPLNVASYNTLSLTYQWKAASVKGTYTTSLYYATSSTGAYTEVTGTGTGATSFVERLYSLPDAAQVSTLYLKIVWNTSNTQAIIDEVELKGVEVLTPHMSATPSSINVDAASATKSISIEYSNFSVFETEVSLFNNEDCNIDFTGGWITNLVIDEETYESITFDIAANSSVSTRTAYLRVYALDEGAEELTIVIPITQEAYVPPTGAFSLYSGDISEGDYVIYYSGKAMKNSIDSKRFQYEEVTPSENIINNPDASIIWHIAKPNSYFVVYSANAEVNKYAAGNGTANQGKMNFNGTDDDALWTITGSSTYEFVNKKNQSSKVNANLRNNSTYGFACYSTNTGGALSLYKKCEYSISLAPDTWTSFAPASDVTIPEDVELSVYKAKLNGAQNALSISKVENGTKLKAGEGVLLKSSSDSEKAFTFGVTTGAVALSDNDLKGITIRTYASNLKSSYSCSHIMVLKGGTNQFGSYTGDWMPANKAFVPFTPEAGAPSVLRIIEEEDNATKIDSVEQGEVIIKFVKNGQLLIERKGIIYDVMGRRIEYMYNL